MKAFRVKCEGFSDGLVAAETRGKAMISACTSLCECGFGADIGAAMKRIRVSQAPAWDLEAATASFNGQWIREKDLA